MTSVHLVSSLVSVIINLFFIEIAITIQYCSTLCSMVLGSLYLNYMSFHDCGGDRFIPGRAVYLLLWTN